MSEDQKPDKSSHDISVTALKPEHWKQFRQVRVHALKSEPALLHGNWEDVAVYPESYWSKILSDPDSLILGLMNNNKMIGMTGVFPYWEDKTGTQGWLGWNYILPDYRAFGYGKLLNEARLDWAKNVRKYECVFVCCRQTNIISQKIYKKSGFVYSHSFETEFQDGMDTEFCYRLNFQDKDPA